LKDTNIGETCIPARYIEYSWLFRRITQQAENKGKAVNEVSFGQHLQAGSYFLKMEFDKQHRKTNK
jgi:hypothetical protein